jgi:hypothetical protein
VVVFGVRGVGVIGNGTGVGATTVSFSLPLVGAISIPKIPGGVGTGTGGQGGLGGAGVLFGGGGGNGGLAILFGVQAVPVVLATVTGLRQPPMRLSRCSA